jgi:tetratricopeptide (TPR) repeat protein
MSSAYDRAAARAQAHFNAGRLEPAVKAYRSALRLAPTSPRAAYNLAAALHELARADETVAIYKNLRGTELHPSAALGLSHISPESMTGADQDMLLRTGRTENIGASFRARAWAALGRMWDAQGRYDDAFAAFAEAARLMAPAPGVLDQMAAQEQLEIERIKRAFSPLFMARWHGRGSDSAAPIFVVGRPRSGTTLIEQILATHRSVAGLREPMALSQAIGAKVEWPPTANSSPDYFLDLAEDYLGRIRNAGWRRSRRFVDKFPQNYFYIGVIALAFPKAVILNSVRDPMDTCFSWFRYVYDTGNEFSHDLAHAGRAYVRYREMMDHWAEVLPGRVIDIDHEALVADPETKIRELITGACRLEWDENCLKFYENERLVKTASKFQVRQPIFTDSIGRWKRYRRHLGPLIEALGPYGPG